MSRLSSICFVALLSSAMFDLSRCSDISSREKRSLVVEDPTSEYMKQTRWTRADLSYEVIGNVASRNQTSLSAVEKAVREAFDDWERNSCFRFKRLNSAQQRPFSSLADIKIVFTNDRLSTSFSPSSSLNFYHRNCTKRFRRNIAHAFFRNNRKSPGHIHINNEILWMESHPISGSISLRSIVAHEIGHVLGLLHSSSSNDEESSDSIMYDYVYTNQVKRVGRSDREELGRIYRDLCASTRRQRRRRRLRVYSNNNNYNKQHLE